MKKSIFFVAIIAVLSLAVSAMAASPVVKVRVVNVDVLGEDAVSTPEGLVKTATMSVAENAKVFPSIESIVLRVGKDQAKYATDVTLPAGALSFDGSATVTGVTREAANSRLRYALAKLRASLRAPIDAEREPG